MAILAAYEVIKDNIVGGYRFVFGIVGHMEKG
jgi:hypothetical protein